MDPGGHVMTGTPNSGWRPFDPCRENVAQARERVVHHDPSFLARQLATLPRPHLASYAQITSAKYIPAGAPVYWRDPKPESPIPPADRSVQFWGTYTCAPALGYCTAGERGFRCRRGCSTAGHDPGDEDAHP